MTASSPKISNNTAASCLHFLPSCDGVSSSNVRYEKTELDYDDGRQKYEIEFRVGNMEYEYEIDATSGNVLKAEKDYDD